MPEDKLISHEAFVIERALNGVIVRPHASWFRRDSQVVAPDELRVFNKLEDFQQWFAQWFPKEPTQP